MMQQLQGDILLTFREAMEYLRVSRSTLYRLMSNGDLVGSKVGHAWRFKKTRLDGCVKRETPRGNDA
jgi:excisionase family DNA binding protein